MQFNEEEIQRVKTLAGLFFSPEEIAIKMDVDVKKLQHIIRNKPNDPITIAYQKAKLDTKEKIRSNVIKFAEHGSHQAQQIVQNYIANQEAKEK